MLEFLTIRTLSYEQKGSAGLDVNNKNTAETQDYQKSQLSQVDCVCVVIKQSSVPIPIQASISLSQ